MRIGINGYEAVVPRFGFDEKTGLPNRVGSSEFCYQLLVALSKLKNSNEFITYLPVEPSKDMPKATSNWKYLVFKSKKLWTFLGLSQKLSKNTEKLNAFFSPTHYLPLMSSVPSVVSIMDVSYLHFPQLFKRKDLNKLKIWGGYSIKRARKVVTISNSSRSDIIKAYRIPAEKVVVVYPGIKQIEAKNMTFEELSKKYSISKKYILFVGTLQPRKNILRLVEAFSKIKEKDLDLIIVGRRGWQFEEILGSPKKFGVEDRVKILENVSNEDLPAFYKNTEFFILPSLYEGFGLPVLEAMQQGCPVITSNVSSLPEAGGDAALYVDPENVEDIASKMEKLLSDAKLREEMIKKGYEQVKKFSWDKAARETLKVLEGVAR